MCPLIHFRYSVCFGEGLSSLTLCEQKSYPPSVDRRRPALCASDSRRLGSRLAGAQGHPQQARVRERKHGHIPPLSAVLPPHAAQHFVNSVRQGGGSRVAVIRLKALEPGFEQTRTLSHLGLARVSGCRAKAGGRGRKGSG